MTSSEQSEKPCRAILHMICWIKMIWSVDGIMDYLTKDMDLQPGDLIYTGTPAGVGTGTVGDELSGGIEGLERITVRFV